MYSQQNIRVKSYNAICIIFFRFPCPPCCPTTVYVRLIYPCWEADPHKRPSFSKLISETEDLLNQYWDLFVLILSEIFYYDVLICDGNFAMTARNFYIIVTDKTCDHSYQYFTVLVNIRRYLIVVDVQHRYFYILTGVLNFRLILGI